MPILAQESTQESTQAPDIVATAQALVDDAERIQEKTLDSVNTLLGMIQVFGIAVAIVGAFLSILGFILIGFGFRNNLRLGEELKKARDASREYEVASTVLQEARDLRKELDTQLEQATQSLSLVQLGTRQVDIGNINVALDIFRQAEQLNSDNPVIKYFIGDLYLRRGQYEEGISKLKPISQRTDLLVAQASYAYALRLKADKSMSQTSKKHDYDTARQVFEELMKKDSNLLDISGECAFGALAGLHKREGDYDKARKIYEHCHAVTPHSSYPVNNLALLYYRFSKHINLDTEQDARAIALGYFEQARNRARYAINISSAEYWNLFDLLTADVALEKASIDELEAHIQQIEERKPIAADIGKLLDGLIHLKEADNPPQHAAAIVAMIESRLT